MKLPDALKETGKAYRVDERGRYHFMALTVNDLVYWRVSAGEQQSVSMKRHFTPRSVPGTLLAHEDWQPLCELT
jgi:hypothetical protein